MKQTLLPYSQYKKIQIISFLILISGFYTFYLKFYDLFFLSMVVYLTSYLHWREPYENSIYQKIDRLSVRLSVIYEFLKSILFYDIPIYTYTFLILGIYSYYKARINSKIDKMKSANWHCGLHLSIFFYHIILYYNMRESKN